MVSTKTKLILSAVGLLSLCSIFCCLVISTLAVVLYLYNKENDSTDIKSNEAISKTSGRDNGSGQSKSASENGSGSGSTSGSKSVSGSANGSGIGSGSGSANGSVIGRGSGIGSGSGNGSGSESGNGSGSGSGSGNGSGNESESAHVKNGDKILLRNLYSDSYLNVCGRGTTNCTTYYGLHCQGGSTSSQTFEIQKQDSTNSEVKYNDTVHFYNDSHKAWIRACGSSSGGCGTANGVGALDDKTGVVASWKIISKTGQTGVVQYGDIFYIQCVWENKFLNVCNRYPAKPELCGSKALALHINSMENATRDDGSSGSFEILKV